VVGDLADLLINPLPGKGGAGGMVPDLVVVSDMM